MAQCSPVTRGTTSQQRSHPFTDQRAHGLPKDLASGQMIEVLTRQPLPPPACQKQAGRTHEMIAFRAARFRTRRRIPERAVEILSVHVSATRTPRAPVRSESTLLADEEATRTDRQLCETSRSCCCAAVAQGQKWHPKRLLATGAAPALTCGYVCSPDGIRTRATALRVPSHSD